MGQYLFGTREAKILAPPAYEHPLLRRFYLVATVWKQRLGRAEMLVLLCGSYELYGTRLQLFPDRRWICVIESLKARCESAFKDAGSV
jgi:hypothetical protein